MDRVLPDSRIAVMSAAARVGASPFTEHQAPHLRLVTFEEVRATPERDGISSDLAASELLSERARQVLRERMMLADFIEEHALFEPVARKSLLASLRAALNGSYDLIAQPQELGADLALFHDFLESAGKCIAPARRVIESLLCGKETAAQRGMRDLARFACADTTFNPSKLLNLWLSKTTSWNDEDIAILFRLALQTGSNLATEDQRNTLVFPLALKQGPIVDVYTLSGLHLPHQEPGQSNPLEKYFTAPRAGMPLFGRSAPDAREAIAQALRMLGMKEVVMENEQQGNLVFWRIHFAP